MQIVYISNRPEILLETLKSVSQFMSDIDKAAVCVPDYLVSEFDRTRSPLKLTVIRESEVLNQEEISSLSKLDHQRRNYLLRTQLAKHASIEAQFIMSDDDARPLKQVGADQFVSGSKFNRYYFYDLRNWDNNQTEFDAGQLSTCAVLQYCSLPTLSYASHMPQIIDRDLFLQSVEYFAPYSRDYALCEWSSYFNYASHHHPDRFNSAKAYVTLCWPEHPLSWKKHVEPADFVFENFTRALYKRNGVFGKLSQNGTEAAITKVVQWRKYEIACKHPEQGRSLLKYLNPRTWVNKLFHHIK